MSALSARVAAPSGPAFSLLDVPADALGSALDATRKKGREQRVLSVDWGAGKMHDEKYLFFFFASPRETLWPPPRSFLKTQPAFSLSDPDGPFFHQHVALCSDPLPESTKKKKTTATYCFPLATAADELTAGEQHAATTLLRAITAGLYDSDDEGYTSPAAAAAAAAAPVLFFSERGNKRRFDALVSSDEDEGEEEGGSSCFSDASAATQRRRPSLDELTSRPRQPRQAATPRTPSRSSSLRSSGSCFGSGGGEGMLRAACNAAAAAKSAAAARDAAAARAAAAAAAAPEQPTTPLPPRPSAPPVGTSSPPPLLPLPPAPRPPRRLRALGRDYWGDAAPPPPPGSAFDVGLPAECCGSGTAAASSGGSEEQLQRCRRPRSPFELQEEQQTHQREVGSNREVQAATPRSLPSLSLAGLRPEQVEAALGSAVAGPPTLKAPGGGISAGPLGLALDTRSLVLEINARFDAAARLAAAVAAGLL